MTFAEPWMLAVTAALILFLGLVALVGEGRRRRRLARFASAGMAPQLAASFSPLRHRLKLGLVLVGTLCLGIAAARPQWGYDWEEFSGRGIDVMIALDTSRSMLAEDIRPSRLDRAKLAILDLVQRLEGDRVGLIAFAGQAFLQCPLTLDYDAFRQTLQIVDTNVIPRGGTDLAAAIAEAQAAFGDDDSFKILVLLTDGEDLEADGLAQARAAAAEGLKIFTVGVGRSEGELIPVRNPDGGTDFLRDPSGNLVRTRLDEETLRAIAATTGGFYVPLGTTGRGLDEVYALGLQSIPPEEREARVQQIPLERYAWPLAAGLFLLFLDGVLGTRRRGLARLLMISGAGLLALGAPHPARAQTEPLEMYQAGNYIGAAELYQQQIEKRPDDPLLRYNYGTSRYAAGDFAAAREELQKALAAEDVALQARSFYNLGNTHFREGEALLEGGDMEGTMQAWETALEQYDNALALDPADRDAAVNQAFVQRKLEELQQQQQQQQQQQDGGEDNEEQQQQDDSQQDQQQQDQGQQDQDQQSSEDGDQQQDQPQQQDGENDQQQQQQSGESGDQEQQESDQQSGGQQPQDDEGTEQQEEQPPSTEGSDEGEQQEEQPQPQPGEGSEGEAGEQTGEPQPMMGRMTPEEARQLLEALRATEQKLPLGDEKREPRDATPPTGRDW